MGMEMLGMGLIMAGSAALSAKSQSKIAKSQAKTQANAAEQAKQNAEKQAEQQREAMRMQNQKSADIGSILQDNTNDLLSGGSTLLTGAGGVDDKELTLAKKSTLG